MPTIIGVDLGAYTIKIATYEGGFGRYQPRGWREMPVPQSAQEAPDASRRLASLRALIAEAIGEKDVSGFLFDAAYPAEAASVRLVSLPFGDRAQVEKVLPGMVEEQVPFDLEDTILASRILSVNPGDSRVLTALSPRTQVQQRLALLAEASVDPKHLALDADLLGVYADRGVQAILDLGHTRTLIALAQDGKVLAARALVGGGRDLTLALAARLNLPWEEAEGRKHAAQLAAGPFAAEPTPAEVQWTEGSGESLPGEEETTNPRGLPALAPPVVLSPVPAALPEDGSVLLQALQPLLAEIRATLIAFEDTNGVEIDEVLLCGGTSYLGGLREVLAEDLGVPNRPVSPSNSPSQAPGDEDQPLRFALAEAIARKAADMTRGRELEMRQGDLAFKGHLATIGNFLRLGVLAATVLLAVGVGWFTVRYFQLTNQLEGAEEQIGAVVVETFPGEVTPDRVQDPATALAIMQEKSAEANRQVELLGSITADVPPVTNVLKQLSDGMPPASEARIDVEELTITEGSVTVKAETDGYEQATRIETSLQDVDAFKDARKGDERKAGENIRFTVTIPLAAAEPTGEEG